MVGIGSARSVDTLRPCRPTLDGGPLLLGWLMTGYAVGGIAGSVAVTRVGRVLPPRILIPLCGTLDGLSQLGLFDARNVPMVMLFIVLEGATAISFFISLQTLVQRSVGDRYRGRVFGVYGATQGIALLCGQILTSALAGCLYPLAGFTTLVMLRRAPVDALVAIAPYIGTARREADERLPAP